MNETKIEIHRNIMSVPKEVYEAMNNPLLLRIIPSVSGSCFLKKFPTFDKEDFNLIIHLVRLKILSLLKHKNANLPCFIKKIFDKQGFAYFSTSSFEDGTFNVVSYHPRYLLMSSDKQFAFKSRENFWKNIKKYHEHLKISEQLDFASQVSLWLSKEIFGKLNAVSFFEIGCGSGRNLFFLRKTFADALISGMDINKKAIETARKNLSKEKVVLKVGSLYSLKGIKSKSVDVVFSVGVLMHVPHDKVVDVIKEMHRIAKVAVIHFELHGENHNFDYHRYPRDYKKIYEALKLNIDQYNEFSGDDFRSRGLTKKFKHSLLVSIKSRIK